jgi:hypothetical protein
MKQVSLFSPIYNICFLTKMIYLKVMEGFTWCLKQDIKETGGAWIAILGNKSFTKASATTFQILKHIGRPCRVNKYCGTFCNRKFVWCMS